MCVVLAAEGVSAAALKEALKKLQVLQALSIHDLAARLDQADPLAAEVAAAEAAHTAAGGTPDALWCVLAPCVQVHGRQ